LPKGVNGDGTGADHLGRGQSLGKGMEHELGSDACILATLDDGQAG
jgi:hypothetical protein